MTRSARRRPRRATGAGARRGSAAGALAAAWLAAVAGIAVVQATTGEPRSSALASTPGGVAHGELWTLLSSGLVVAGVPVAQLAGTALVVAGVVRALGGTAFWAVALAGHVGATLLTYAGVGLVALAGGHDVDRVIDAPDFGISAVWAACLGALAAAGVLRRDGAVGRAAGALGVAGLIVFAALVPMAHGVAAVEHLVAFVLGGAVAAILIRRDPSSGAEVRRRGCAA